ncbi:MAG TPA: zinc-dependent alcohol dehydrogenase family protein [Candidatus Brocadiia bacterium]|nr:zinc-dependent alcohol dehydrogenase family protein [Candidatus Brocadiia bacterium]
MKSKMKAVIFDAPGHYKVGQAPVPAIQKPTDVLLQVEASSICGTDVHILEVPPGHPATVGSILGHEYTGKVLEVGKAVNHLAPGDRVVVDPNITCGRCGPCREGMHNMCDNMTTLGIFMDGGFAEYNVAPAQQLFPIPMEMPPEDAVFCEPLACVVNGCRRAALQTGERAVVLGAGPIGLLFTQMLKASGAGKVIVAEISPFRSKLAKKSGADIVVNPQKDDVAAIVKEETGGGPEVVVDAVGSLMPQAIDLVARGGRVLLFGQNSNAKPPITQNLITRKEIAVLGSYIARHTFPQAVKILAGGLLNLKPLVTHRISLDEFDSGLKAMQEGRAVEVIVFPF